MVWEDMAATLVFNLANGYCSISYLFYGESGWHNNIRQIHAIFYMPKHDITVDSAEIPVTLKLVILIFFLKPIKGLSHEIKMLLL
jgi:hypothetical protein